MKDIERIKTIAKKAKYDYKESNIESSMKSRRGKMIDRF